MPIRCATAAVLVWLCGLSAAAQAPNPVLEHYRAYQAALAAEDFAAAEAAAAAALAASEARDGDGGRTAVLAFNLAVLRLDIGQREQALAPAQRVRALAGETSGVDPLLAELILGRAELAQRGNGGPERLIRAFAGMTPGYQQAAYDAAIDLGNWALAEDRLEAAQHGWAAALAFTTAGEGDDWRLDRARAYLGLGATFMLGGRNYLGDNLAPYGGTRLPFDRNADMDGRAHSAFDAAMDLIRPLASRPPVDLAITVPQRVYAEAYAWRTALRARMISQDLRAPPAESGLILPLSDMRARQRCQPRVTADPLPRYPAREASRYRVGSVVVRYVLDEGEQVLERRIVAHVGSDRFVASVEAVLPRWRIEMVGPPGCIGDLIGFQCVTFILA